MADSETKTKKCQKCRKLLDISIYTNEKGDILGKCSPCRIKLVKTTNICKVCGIKAIYNFEGEKNAICCYKHKEVNMINIKHKKCETKGCKKYPVFNFEGKTTPSFCSEHKEDGMVNVTSNRCESDGCEKRPNYNTRGETKGRFCLEHKEPHMVDVKNKRCETDGCETITSSGYGWLGKGKSHCATHRQKGMITSPNRKCETSCCKQLGTHESEGVRYCEDHKPSGAENLGVDTCTVCGLEDILTNGKCNTCDPSILHIRRHAKENRVRDVLTASGIKFVHDKMLEGTSCGRERPDFQIDCETHFVYVEVDEHQHNSYACECEQTRMINLVEARGMPVRFIRYNPDVYEPMKGQRKVKLEQREKKLVEYVKYAMTRPPQEEGVFSNVLYLFYDEYDTTNQVWHKLVGLF